MMMDMNVVVLSTVCAAECVVLAKLARCLCKVVSCLLSGTGMSSSRKIFGVK